MVFVKTLQNNYKTKKIYFIFMHTAKSLKDKKKIITLYFRITKKNHIVFFMHKTKTFEKGFSMHFGFNNKFVRAMRTWPIFQKF
jgi:hypothetical protein